MKDALAVVATVGLAILAVLGIFYVSGQQDRRAWREEKQQLAARVQSLEEHLAVISEVTNSLASQLAAARRAELSNATVAATLSAAIASADNSSTNPVNPRPYQVQAYLGQKSVGLAWAIPTNVRRDPKTGRVTFEQVVSLPETARGALTAYVTNVLERPVPSGTTQVIERETYVDRRPDWYWGPAWYPAYPAQPDRPPEAGHRQPPQIRVSPGRSGGPWTPVSVASRPAPSRGLYVPPRAGEAGIYVPSGLR